MVEEGQADGEIKACSRLMRVGRLFKKYVHKVQLLYCSVNQNTDDKLGHFMTSGYLPRWAYTMIYVPVVDNCYVIK